MQGNKESDLRRYPVDTWAQTTYNLYKDTKVKGINPHYIKNSRED